MISLLISFALAAAPHKMYVNGQRMLEWAPVTYDTGSHSLIVDDFYCDPWLPNRPAKMDQEKAMQSGNIFMIFFKLTGRFYPLTQAQFNPETQTWFIRAVDSLQCTQNTLFKDDFE